MKKINNENKNTYYIDYDGRIDAVKKESRIEGNLGVTFFIVAIGAAISIPLAVKMGATAFLGYAVADIASLIFGWHLCNSSLDTYNKRVPDLLKRQAEQEVQKERNNEGNKRAEMREDIRKDKEEIKMLENSKETNVKKLVENDERIESLRYDIKRKSAILQEGCGSRKAMAKKIMLKRKQLREDRQRS